MRWATRWPRAVSCCAWPTIDEARLGVTGFGSARIAPARQPVAALIGCAGGSASGWAGRWLGGAWAGASDWRHRRRLAKAEARAVARPVRGLLGMAWRAVRAARAGARSCGCSCSCSCGCSRSRSRGHRHRHRHQAELGGQGRGLAASQRVADQQHIAGVAGIGQQPVHFDGMVDLAHQHLADTLGELQSSDGRRGRDGLGHGGSPAARERLLSTGARPRLCAAGATAARPGGGPGRAA